VRPPGRSLCHIVTSTLNLQWLSKAMVATDGPTASRSMGVLLAAVGGHRGCRTPLCRSGRSTGLYAGHGKTPLGVTLSPLSYPSLCLMSYYTGSLDGIGFGRTTVRRTRNAVAMK
jgi:hypothetical protein